MISDKRWNYLRRKFPEGTIVRINPKARLRDYLAEDTLYKTGEVGRDWGNIFCQLKDGRIGFFVAPKDIIIISFKEKVIFT